MCYASHPLGLGADATLMFVKIKAANSLLHHFLSLPVDQSGGCVRPVPIKTEMFVSVVASAVTNNP